jgi:hypothetical protein
MTVIAEHAKTYTVPGGAGLKLHVREWGDPDAPPILFIHGWSANHLCWSKQYQSTLADQFRVIAYDLRGHGMSEAPLEPENYTYGELWADDVAAIIDELERYEQASLGWKQITFSLGLIGGAHPLFIGASVHEPHRGKIDGGDLLLGGDPLQRRCQLQRQLHHDRCQPDGT